MTRTEKLELLLTMSQRVDSYTRQLKLNERMYNDGVRWGLCISENLYNIKKYKRFISVTELRFNRLSNGK